MAAKLSGWLGLVWLVLLIVYFTMHPSWWWMLAPLGILTVVLAIIEIPRKRGGAA